MDVETKRTVRNIIQGRPLVTVRETQSIAEAFEIESRNNVHRVPVLSEDNRLVGILSINDIRLCIESPLFHTNKEIYDSMQKAKVSDVMHKSLITVDIDDTLSNVAKILRVASINGVPVLEKGTLVGVVSRSDLLDELIRIVEPL